ncbi:inactive tyrosine-protein kinase PRAG1 isoform X2 [Mastacembelus armatus]|uniref:inactive tyrosine-protein kinase PRAG1 isoform X2 n=1 Tax=Mastacembelus armatus TaxID=205130 RepID=UPI000E4546B9|nr:inactive tyrosine-protein kinase PRAG1-like isoform X2 [Mastacembelus armatus]
MCCSDPFRHQVRFFSDNTPPPIPKKRLARTLSLPGTDAPPLSPPSSLWREPQNFDNPLYMVAPIPNTYFLEETEEFKPARMSSMPLLPFSQLSFDTPDEHLAYLFSSFDDQRAVSQGIQYRHLLFLRSMVQSVEAETMLQRKVTESDISSYQPQDFLLCEGSEPKQIGDSVYYRLHSPKFPGRVLGLKVCKQIDEVPSAHTKHHSSHVNVQDVVVQFRPCNATRNDSITPNTQDPCLPSKSDCSAAKLLCGASTEYATDPMCINMPSIQSLLQKGHCVSIERDLPHVTLKDFVEDSSSLRSTECLVYDRQVCILLLQILMGTQHLYNTSDTAAALRAQDILLVWPSGEKNKEENNLEVDVYEGERCFKTSRLKEEMEKEKAEEKGRIQMLWWTRGSARVVLTPQASSLHPLLTIKSQIDALIQYCLHPQGSMTILGTGPSLSKSLHQRGLLYLSSLLQNESGGLHIADMVTMLQVLLWGPRVPLLNHRGSTTTAVHNWLIIKRALLVMKLAERGLIQDQSALDWEDCLCLQYLSFTDPETVVSVTRQLWLTLKD